MYFTDIFIRRPVLASVVSLLILVLGLRAYSVLPILQYPRTENAIVTVSTLYYGADPDVVAGFITTPLENAIAQANGIDYMSSVSATSTSTITVYLRLNYDADKALTEINTKIASVLSKLPPGTLQPTLTVTIGQTIDAMYIGFNSDALAPNQITDYLVRVVQPKLQAVPGVQTAELLGSKVFALRAWLDPKKLAAFGLTATDVSAALTANDYISGIGTTTVSYTHLVSLPSQLVEQRPDIRAAEAQLHQASAQIGVAIANRLPQFNLTGAYGSAALNTASLFTPTTLIWSAAASSTQPIFHGFTLLHQQRAAEAGYDMADAQYRTTVLQAFQNVADALRALQLDAATLKAQRAALRAASDTLDLAGGQYRLGAIAYVILLNAQRSYQQSRLAVVQAQAARYADTAALFQALGGGWWNRADVAPNPLSPDSPDDAAATANGAHAATELSQ